MKILFDTNVVLDLLLDREPFVKPASSIISRVEEGEILGFLAATSITTLYYLCQKALDPRTAREHVKALMSIFEIAPVTRRVLSTALELDFPDFEDAVLHAAAHQSDNDGIVTRNTRDFSSSDLPVYTPSELENVFQADKDS